MKRRFLLVLGLVIILTMVLSGCDLLSSLKKGTDLKRLFDAVKVGDSSLLKEYIREGKDLNVAMEGETLLIAAAARGHAYLVGLLLEAGAPVDTVNPEDGLTALLSTLHYLNDESYDVAELLVAHGADVNFSTESNMTALMLAAKQGLYDEVELLLSRGALLDEQESRAGYSALMYAAFHDHSDVVDLLLRSGADASLVDASNWTAKDLADQFASRTTQDLLAAVPPPVPDTTPKADARDLLTALRGDKKLNNGDFMECVNGSLYEETKLYLQIGADPNLSCRDGMDNEATPIYAAIQNADLAMVKILTEAGADLNFVMHPLTPVAFALSYEAYDIAAYLVDMGADVDLITGDNWDVTPLMHFAFRGDFMAVDFLLGRDADPFIASVVANIGPYPVTALDLAEMEGHDAVAALLQRAMDD